MDHLVVRAKSGDRDAFGELFVLCKPRVHSLVMQKLRNAAEADEVTQDIFLRAFRKLHQLEDVTKFTGWLCQIAARLCINRVVRKPKEKYYKPELLDLARKEWAPIMGIVKSEDETGVRRALQKLRENERAVLVAFYFDDYSVREIAEQSNVPIGTVKRRLFTARGRLKEVMGHDNS